jgi:hypothetical protein
MPDIYNYLNNLSVDTTLTGVEGIMLWEPAGQVAPFKVTLASLTSYLGTQIGGGGGGSSTLDGLTDVTLTSPVTGQYLNFNGSNWVNNTLTFTLDDLSNVTAPSPTNGQALVWVNANSRWEAATISGGGGGATTLDGLTDVNTGTPVDATAYSLTWDAANSRYNLAVISGGGGGEPDLNVPRTYIAQQQQGQVAVTYAATFAMNCNTQPSARIVLTGNITLAAPTNAVAGGNYIINLTQDATGGRTITVPVDPFAPEGNVALTFDTAANAVNILSLHCVSTSPLKFIASLLTGRP